MKSALITGSLLLALAGSAAAQPGATPLAAPHAPVQAAPAPAPAPELKSEQTALGLSLGGTIAAWGLLLGGGAAPELGAVGVLGVMVAPSFGHWYSGTFWTRGLGMRLGSLPVATLGLLVAIAGCPIGGWSHDTADEDRECNEGPGIAIMAGAAALFIAGTIDDIRTAPRRARSHNQAIADLAVAPIVTHQSAGLALGGRF